MQISCPKGIKRLLAMFSRGWWHRHLPYRDSGQIHFTTIIIDEFDRGNGFQVEWEGHNLITTGMKTLLAVLLANQPGYVGVQYMAIGSGDPNGDPLNPAAPNVSDTKLATEVARVPVTVSFLDDLGNPTTGTNPSTHVQIQGVFGEGVGSGNNVEFGLFGGNAGGGVNGGGYLLDRITHPVKYKLSGDVRRITIVINF